MPTREEANKDAFELAMYLLKNPLVQLDDWIYGLKELEDAITNLAMAGISGLKDGEMILLRYDHEKRD